MNVLTIVLAIAIPLGTAALTAWINIKIKFAPDAAHAMRETRSIFLTMLMIFFNLLVLGWLIITVLYSPWPLDRLTFLAVLFNALVLLHNYFLWVLGILMRVMERFVAVQDVIASAFKKGTSEQ